MMPPHRFLILSPLIRRCYWTIFNRVGLGLCPKGIRWRASEGQTQATVASHSFSQQQYDHELRHNFLKEPTDAQLAQEWGVSSLFLR